MLVLLDFLFLAFFFELLDDVRAEFGETPDEVVVSCEIEAEIEPEIFSEAYIEWRAKLFRPEL